MMARGRPERLNQNLNYSIPAAWPCASPWGMACIANTSGLNAYLSYKLGTVDS
eukprot:SAG31_NODE_26981_length_433_cov_0.862275_1_plen_52_part_10